MIHARKAIKFGFVMTLTVSLTHHMYAQDRMLTHKALQAAVVANLDKHAFTNQNQELPLHALILNQTLQIQDKLSLIQEILDTQSVNINAQDANGRTALNIATFYKADPEIVQLLLSYKADVNKPDLFNQSPLHNAIKKEEITTAKLLLHAGADAMLQNDSLATPIDLARSPKTKALFGFE